MRDVTTDDAVFHKTVALNPGIDQDRLLAELRLVNLHYCSKGFKINLNTGLMNAFNWAGTPQGQAFWTSLWDGRGFPE